MSDKVPSLKKLSIIVPVYNEEDNLSYFSQALIKILSSIHYDWEIIFIDDGSKDNSWSIIHKMAEDNYRIKGLSLSRNFGKEAALCAGLESINSDLVVTMDADMQHPPELVKQLIERYESSSANVVEALKENREHDGIMQVISSKLFYLVFNALAGYNLTNSTEFQLFDHKVLLAWQQLHEKNIFFRGSVKWLGFAREQVHFSVSERHAGETKWSVWSRLKLAVSLITGFSTIPLHFISLSGTLFLIFSFFLGLQTLYQKYMGISVDGFTTVILLLLIIGGLLMTGLGIIGVYIETIFLEVKNRPRYLISSSINRDKE